MATNQGNLVYQSIEGALWEEYPWELRFDFISEVEYLRPCKHCSDVWEEERTIFKYTNTVEVTKCPRVIVAWNEGKYNSTGVCLDCVLEALDKIKEV